MDSPNPSDHGKCSRDKEGKHSWIQNTRYGDEHGPKGQHDGGSHFYERYECELCHKKTPWRKVY